MFEAYLGDRWYTFDPRNDQHRIARTVIGRGREELPGADDLSPEKARIELMIELLAAA